MMKWLVIEIVGKVGYRLDGYEDIEINSLLDQIRGVGAAAISGAEVVECDLVDGPELTL